ncbi:5-hydroxytryptamine receptor 2B-like [Anneissia japonica]|uniref:5-hydroxytryptamine receptor 2B-like n=1 Tax=Anneissia japonica TaxID=1529436 RepID=UPI0014255801|nr:5-hydroxytryptamine receptor 2B-like [Anneissia japonica]XP_033108098.1 5-hydroxytryptamine receptor 2B-like [Anneissia japonica]XP_033108099.1 5-hydroxytryptamine receptor 2B-like [Anneissia japonica]
MMLNSSTHTSKTLLYGAAPTGVGLIFTNMFVCILSVLTIGGNALTITVFSRDSSLRNNPQSNRHIMSLAVADLAVGLIPLPLLVVINIADIWPFGIPLCMLKSIVEGTFLIVTIFTIAFISLDRYLLVHKEYPNYLKIQTKLRVNLQIAFTWTFSVVLMVTNEILYFYQIGFESMYNLFCNFHTNPDTNIFLLIILLFIPMLAIMYFNIKTFLNIRKRILRRRRIGVEQTLTVRSTSVVLERPLGINENETRNEILTGRPNLERNIDLVTYHENANCHNFGKTNRDHPQRSQNTSGNAHNQDLNENKRCKLTCQIHQESKNVRKGNLTKYPWARTSISVIGSRSGKSQTKDASFKRRYVRPAMMMGVLLSTFLICWVPLGVTGFMKNFKTVFEDPRLWKWIHICMYMDSLFNPILYAITNKKIRIAMIKCFKRN